MQMKSIARIFVPLIMDEGSEASLRLAAAIARPFGAHVAATFFRVDPLSLPLAYSEPYTLAPVIELIQEQEREAAARNHALFARWSQEEAIESETAGEEASAAWRETMGHETQQIAQIGRLNDLSVFTLGPKAAGRARAMFQTALFETGRPIMLAPAGDAFSLLGKALVAWDGSMEAARALSAALPMLARCASVEVFTRPEPSKADANPEDVVAFLGDHGITAAPCRVEPDEGEVWDAIAEACQRTEAGLLVMGAYTRSRLREVIFGGVTRDLLDRDLSTAIFLSH
jgi:nucleotide-binding universal stress UspA family protein